MPKLILKAGARQLKDCAIGAHPVTIGRLPDNLLVIDNPAVSGHHARVYKDGTQFVFEDLKSTNGSFVRDKPIARHTLAGGDVVVIGKHTLVFSEEDGGDLEVPAAASVGGAAPATAPLLRELESGRASQTYEAVVPKTAIPTSHGRIGTMTVRAGNTGQSEYVLAAVTTLIGTEDTAQIRLKGWFQPKVAAAIARRGEGFTITPLRTKVTVNGERITSLRELISGDVIEVSGLTLEFKLS